MNDFDKWPRDVHGRLICSPEHPMPADRPMTGLHWAHKEAFEEACGSDDVAQYHCKTCGIRWREELPQ